MLRGGSLLRLCAARSGRLIDANSRRNRHVRAVPSNRSSAAFLSIVRSQRSLHRFAARSWATKRLVYSFAVSSHRVDVCRFPYKSSPSLRTCRGCIGYLDWPRRAKLMLRQAELFHASIRYVYTSAERQTRQSKSFDRPQSSSPAKQSLLHLANQNSTNTHSPLLHSCAAKFFAANAKVGERMQAMSGGAAGGAKAGGGFF